MSSNVNHPEHYQNIAGVEAIDILNDVVKDLPGTQAALLWNALKYQLRFQNKNGVEDLKKARNYLKYLIDNMESAHGTDNKEILWETWFSNEYGNMTIFSKTKKPNGRPSRLTFDTKDAAEEFESVFYNMLSEGYDEFSITDVSLEMKFKTTKGNNWNKWDDLVNWKEVHDSFTIKPVDDKYELIFNYKQPDSKTTKNIKTDHSPRVIYKSKISGHAEVYYSMHMYAGTCTSIAFTSDLCRDMFIASFFNKLGKKTFSIRDVLADANFIIPEDTDTFSIRLPWNDLFSIFKPRTEDGKYILDLVYTHEILEASKTLKNNQHIVYKSTVYGSADIYYSKELLAGTCTKILFDDKDGRYAFMIKFFRRLGYCRNGFSIKSVLLDATYRFHKEDTDLCIYAPWNEIFGGFRMHEEDDKYVLEFVYKKETDDDDSEPLLGEEWYAWF